jgi:hypothetical protein
VLNSCGSEESRSTRCATQLLTPPLLSPSCTRAMSSAVSKTFTMGSGNNLGVSDASLGMIPRVVHDMYSRVSRLESAGVYVLTKVSYLEIYNEELIDLLHSSAAPQQNNMALPHTIPKPPVIAIREDPAAGGVVLTGVREETVADFGAMMRCLARGAVGRTTGSTLMNQHSSRSHAIFTILIEQRREKSSPTVDASQRRSGSAAAAAASGAISHTHEVTRSKFHLVDLAGSERASKTGASGVRFKESVNINRGLLALGNVIQALSMQSQQAAASGGNTLSAAAAAAIAATAARHIPYRESKLTRLLQGSLGQRDLCMRAGQRAIPC